MFRYKLDVFKTFETTRKPIKLKTFVYLIAIAVLLVPYVYSQAKVGKTLPTSI